MLRRSKSSIASCWGRLSSRAIVATSSYRRFIRPSSISWRLVRRRTWRRSPRGGGPSVLLRDRERQGATVVTLFLCGDVMTGRGVDQILPHPSAPEVFEPCVRDAREYVALAELASGPIPRAVAPRYIWGDALEEVARAAPDARIINLETSVTSCDDYCLDKRISYRMHPDNIACLTTARIDVCVL